MKIEKVQPYNAVAMDITSYCNLKCPFCLSNHSVPKKRMDRETLRKAISLLPLVEGANFLFSCLYEPTIHPQFSDFLQEIPIEFRQKVFFSTNLSYKLTDETLDTLARSSIHHINISVDSLEVDTYESFRQGAKFPVFLDNLQRIVQNFSHYEDSPDLHFISMVNRINYHEIPKLIQTCSEKYRATFHEIREYWLLSHQGDLEWCKKNRLLAEDYADLEQSLQGLKYNYSFSGVGLDLGICHPDNPHKGFDVIDESFRRANLYHLSSNGKGLRIHADGIVEVLGRNIRFDMSNIADPCSFFTELAEYIDLDHEKTKELQRVSGKLIHSWAEVRIALPSIQYSIDEIKYTPNMLTLRGWCFDESGERVRINFMFPDQQVVKVVPIFEKSPDVEAVHGPQANQCRFTFNVHLNYAFSVDSLKPITLVLHTGNPVLLHKEKLGRKLVRKTRTLVRWLT